MNKLLKIFTPFFGLVFISILVLTAWTILDSPFLAQDTSGPETGRNHFAFFLPAVGYSFFQNLKQGALETAESLNCAISFFDIDSNPTSLEMAPYMGVNGVAVYIYKDDNNIRESMSRLVSAGIPVVQIENDVLTSPQSFFIGTNSFDSGKAIGRLASKLDNRSIRAVIIYSDKNPGFMSDANLLELGIKTILGDRLKALTPKRTSHNPLDAERLAYELIQQKADIDLVIFTDPNDTLVAVQALIDMNMVGQVQIIGFGEDKEIREYIDKGIILGSVARNPYQIGLNAVIALQEINENGFTSAYVDTGVSIIGSEDVQPSDTEAGR
ncbi:MAG: substrate-binding domain-containing protein [Spirochaetales bacterium]|nr:substrate-binding domain-containing protein [Spirochaetales bacterium]